MNKNSNQKFDLEERTFNYARRVRIFVKKISKTMCNFEDVPQFVRSSGSVGANYIEANDSPSKKDFYMRVRICRKEVKESRFWLKLLDLQAKKDLETERGF